MYDKFVFHFLLLQFFEVFICLLGTWLLVVFLSQFRLSRLNTFTLLFLLIYRFQIIVFPLFAVNGVLAWSNWVVVKLVYATATRFWFGHFQVFTFLGGFISIFAKEVVYIWKYRWKASTKVCGVILIQLWYLYNLIIQLLNHTNLQIYLILFVIELVPIRMGLL